MTSDLKRRILSAADVGVLVYAAAVRPRARQVARRLERGAPLKLHFGCGSVLLDNWVNIDRHVGLNPMLRGGGRVDLKRRPQLLCDLARKLPFQDGVASHAYSNNFLEHLSRSDAEAFLRESRRVLATGGTMRVVVPDIQQYVRAYVDGDRQFLVEGTAVGAHFWPAHCRDPLDFLVTAVRGSAENGWVHQWGWDEATLARALKEAGFRHVERHPLDASDDPVLANLDGGPFACLALEARA